MAAPRTIKKAYWNKERKKGRPKNSINKILESLENEPATFEELRDRTGLAGTTISDGLVELEKLEKIERTVEPPRERGRGKKNRIVIRLCEKELSPIAKTIRHLDKIASTEKQFDSSQGFALLIGSVISTVKEIDIEKHRELLFKNLQSKKGAEEYLKKLKSEQLEFNEVMLLRALACLAAEREFLNQPSKIRPITNLIVLSIIKKNKLTSYFDNLLEWVKPVIESTIGSTIFFEEKNNHLARLYYSSKEWEKEERRASCSSIAGRKGKGGRKK
jgi:DNA-binding HxlR family transcriptional regulator